MKTVLVISLLLLSSALHAAVTCSGNENTAVVETTPNEVFTDNGDGTVTQNSTGLVWMRCSLGQSWDGTSCRGSATGYKWHTALQAALDINSGASDFDGDASAGYAGWRDWRVPNRNELESIVEERCARPVINAGQFPDTPSGEFWSSVPFNSQYAQNRAWAISFDTGYTYGALKYYDTGMYVRLVRAGR